MKRRSEEESFEQLATGDAPKATASARLKSRIYSAIMRREAQSGPLRTVAETRAEGRGLCVFERVAELTPLPQSFQSLNFCRTCHARVLAESIENAPIYWHNCPYVAFQKPRKA